MTADVIFVEICEDLFLAFGDSGEVVDTFFPSSGLIFGRLEISQRSLCSFKEFAMSAAPDFFNFSNFLNISPIFSKHSSSPSLLISVGITVVWIKNLSELIAFNLFIM